MDEAEVRFVLRLPEALDARLRAAAEVERRSINAQMLVFLEQQLDRWEQGYGRR